MKFLSFFTIELPKYPHYIPSFFAYELETITAIKGEEEVLLIPYTRFQVLEEPKIQRSTFCTYQSVGYAIRLSPP